MNISTRKDKAPEVVTNENTGNKAKVGKYLTEIKELPPSLQEDEMAKEKPKQVEDGNRGHSETEVQKQAVTSLQKGFSPAEADESGEGGELKKRLPLSSKDIILGVINLVSLVLLIIILVRFSERAEELKNLRLEALRNESGVSFEFSEIKASKGKVNELDNLFLDDSGVVNFVGEIDKLKGEGGAVKNITFASQKVVKDRSGNYGIPVIIELSGSWESINLALQKIQKLPFLFRPVNITIEPSEEDEAIMEFNYGGFLYVEDRLGENR